MLIISDCGATKADWAVIRDGEDVLKFSTCGFNAAVEKNADKLASSLKNGLERLSVIPGVPLSLYIYCAGVVSETLASEFQATFHAFFPGAQVEIYSDMLGAARAVCGHNAGVVGILGTGSNSCIYDGNAITLQGRGGGYVLGDEASGAWFGKRLLSDYIRRLLPRDLDEALGREYDIDYQKIVQGVYRSGVPSAYLASYFPFVQQHRDSPYIKQLMQEGLALYFDRVLSAYCRELESLPLSFCGSVAYFCRDRIRECASERGWKIAGILRSPIEGLIDFHSSDNGI